ncbi:mitochondrial outer membrane protein porin of 36 kDa isoform X2 [Hevea brasiliensis]|uniref:mitochondrial outer membrane protein porin of 36 kDa isoform X2 n=1 Tax=Hevea brasiliensis TaxID=3981 RepID=UPI000B786D50|nr:mitochondrial outer membrane protein porin of 36 kDa isoform X2 [Hevea brasiliensis]
MRPTLVDLLHSEKYKRHIFKSSEGNGDCNSQVELRLLRDYFGIAAGVGVQADEQGPFRGYGYNPVVNLSGVAGNTLFSLGTDISFNVAKGTFDEFSAGLSFNSPFLISALNLDDKLDAVKASCYYTFNPLTRTAIAAELKHNFSENGATIFTVGAQHSLFPFTLMKARVNNEAKIGGLIRFEVWEKLLVAITGEVDFRASNNKISQVGMSMAFSL